MLLCTVLPSASRRRPLHVAASAHGGASCSSDSDCNLNGVCTAGACACDRGWSGASCGLLDLLPVEASSPAATSGQIWPPKGLQQSAWGGNVVAGEDGGFELVVSDLGACGLEAWQTNSRIVSAKSKSLTGPFVFDSEVMGAFAHNANPVKISAGPDSGALAVFHVGDGATKGSLRRCSNGTTPPPESSAPVMGARRPLGERSAARNSTKGCKPQSYAPIDLAKSISTPYRNGSSGAWSSVRQSCVGQDLKRGPPWSGCPHFSNAAPLILANGTSLILHAGCPGSQGNGLNLAVAPHWTGPYRPLRGTDSAGHNEWYTPSIDTHAFNSNGCTDPFLFMDPRGRYHALFHCHWQGDDSGDEGGHAFSTVQPPVLSFLLTNARYALLSVCASSLTNSCCARVGGWLCLCLSVSLCVSLCLSVADRMVSPGPPAWFDHSTRRCC